MRKYYLGTINNLYIIIESCKNILININTRRFTGPFVCNAREHLTTSHVHVSASKVKVIMKQTRKKK